MKAIKDGKNPDTVRWFCHTGDAWYGKSALLDGEVDEVVFGGTAGEMRMVWQEVGGKVIPELRVFDDAWAALAEFSDLFAMMATIEQHHAETGPVTGKQFCQMLRQCGFKDQTERVQGEQPQRRLA